MPAFDTLADQSAYLERQEQADRRLRCLELAQVAETNGAITHHASTETVISRATEYSNFVEGLVRIDPTALSPAEVDRLRSPTRIIRRKGELDVEEEA